MCTTAFIMKFGWRVGAAAWDKEVVRLHGGQRGGRGHLSGARSLGGGFKCCCSSLSAEIGVWFVRVHTGLGALQGS